MTLRHSLTKHFTVMQDYNKQNLILFGILVAVGLTLFSTAIVFSGLKDTLWAMPFPLISIGYGLYAFLKKYLPMTGKPNNKQ